MDKDQILDHLFSEKALMREVQLRFRWQRRRHARKLVQRNWINGFLWGTVCNALVIGAALLVLR